MNPDHADTFHPLKAVMLQHSTQTSEWDSVAAELRAYSAQHKQTWGDLDHALLGRFLAGEVTPEERAQVEAALDEHPELRLLTDIVSDVLADTAPVTTPVEEAPRILSFTSAGNASARRSRRFRQMFALAAAACVMLALGIALRNDSRSPGDSRLAMSSPAMGEPEATRVHMFRSAHDAESLDQVRELLLAEDASKTETFAAAPLTQGASPIDRIESRNERLQIVSKVQRIAEKERQKLAMSRDLKEVGIRVRAFPAPPQGVADPSTKTDRSTVARSDGPLQRDRLMHNSVPYLLYGVNQQVDKQLQKKCAETLGRMGGHAQNVVPRLVRQLECTDCPIQKGNIVLALEKLGRLGVRDPKHILDRKTLERLNEKIRELSTSHQVFVVAEAVKQLPEMKMKQYRACKDVSSRDRVLAEVARGHRARLQNNPRTAYVLICLDPPAIQVTMDDQVVRKDGIRPVASSDPLEKTVYPKDLSAGIDQVVTLIEKTVAK
jgi:hypothetical protein